MNVNAPRINFVGGQQLTSTGASESSGTPKLYPPGGPTTTAAGGVGVGTDTPGGEDNQEEAHEIEAVGRLG